ncbi:interferon regulatory factor 7 isoform X2 [Colius striatus]|uniref:interferon regulatory factor 7 isoform X2 n=1 Tax=Colius striatus TaxID=57412 RepID=UPI002B1D17A1|nr:interferon regulatory factor 7 isoform X2 [Colius striatus]
MAEHRSQGEPEKLRFVPWLLRAVSSGKYRGLCWTDRERSAFRVPWKHNARKDVTSSDLEVFKAWAMASGRYEGYPEDPAKWKTNFRCALSSTRMFKLLEDRSKCGDDPHKVFTVTPDALRHSKEGDLINPNPALGQQRQLELNPQDAYSENSPPGSSDLPQSMLLEDLELLQLVLQHCDISCDLGPQPPPWEPRGDPPHQDALLQPHPDPGQNNGLPTSAFEEWVPVAEQHPMGTYSSPAPMLLEQPAAVPLLCHLPQPAGPVPSPGQAMLFAPAASPAPPPPQESTDGIIPTLDISIYYRGKLFLREEVGGSGCLLVYQPLDPAVALRPGHLLRFPSPDELPDQKQRQFTEKLLGSAGLQLEQRAHKLFATRLKKCRVFWALSQQLEGAREPPYNLLCRDQETPIFDFNEFCTELRRFRNGQRQQSPDFTIYLCFGQCLSNAKPKESKLILVKLVPKFCEYWYEQVLREGASSLDSGTVSLQLSDSFSLFELIEQCNMQLD